MQKNINLNRASWVVLVCGFTVLTAQEPKWFLTAGGGWTLLPMTSINNKHSAEVEGWAEHGLQLAEFDELGKTGMIAIRVQYRFSHSGALTASYSAFSQKVGTNSLTPGLIFNSTRTIGLDDFAIGILQYFPEIIYPAELYFELAVGKAHTFFNAWKVADVLYYTVPTVFDEVANYTADQGYGAVALGVNLPLLGPLVLNGEARFKSILVGPMDGVRIEGGVEREDQTWTAFNFSGIYLSLGLGVAF